MSYDYFSEPDDAASVDYEFLQPSVGEVLKIAVWSAMVALLIVCAFINLQ